MTPLKFNNCEVISGLNVLDVLSQKIGYQQKQYNDPERFQGGLHRESAIQHYFIKIILNFQCLPRTNKAAYSIEMIELKLDEALKARGLSRRQFAKKIGVRYNNITRLFKPGYDPKLSSLEKYARVLGCKIRDLFKDI